MTLPARLPRFRDLATIMPPIDVPPPSPVVPYFLTESEAVKHSGIGRVWLKKLTQANKLHPVWMGRWKYSRIELETLADPSMIAELAAWSRKLRSVAEELREVVKERKAWE